MISFVDLHHNKACCSFLSEQQWCAVYVNQHENSKTARIEGVQATA